MFRFLWRTQDFLRVQLRPFQCRWVPLIPPSRSCLCWRPERRDPPAGWSRPSCPRGRTAAWSPFRVSLELRVRPTDTYLISPLSHHCLSCLIFLFYFTASPNSKFTDTPKSSTPLTSGKYSCSFILLCHSRVCQQRIKLTVFLVDRCEPASQTVTTQTRPGRRLKFVHRTVSCLC